MRMGGSGLDLSSSQSGQVAGFLGHRNEFLGSIKFGEFFHCLLASERRLFCADLFTHRMRKDCFILFALEFNH